MPIGILAAVVLALNSVLLLVAASDRSWGAFAIAMFVGPIANGVLCLVAFGCTQRRLGSWFGTRGSVPGSSSV